LLVGGQGVLGESLAPQCGDDDVAAEATAMCPVQEVPKSVSAAAAGVEPPFDVVLRRVDERDVAAVEPGQEFEGCADPERA